MEPVSDFLGDQGGVAAGAVVDDEVDLDLVLYGLVYDFRCIFEQFRIQHAAEHFVKREGFGIGFFVGHSKRSDKPDDYLFPRVEEPLIHLGKLLP
jgi:hypothetical protein